MTTGNPCVEGFDYAAFGRAFFEHAVTQSRIERAFGGVSGRQIDFGPTDVGPGGLISITGQGKVRAVAVTRDGSDPVAFDARIPVHVELTVSVAGRDHRFDADLIIPLRLTALARPPLRIFIDITPPIADEIDVTLDAQGFAAGLIGRTAGVGKELRRYIARYVQREIEKPRVLELRDIDVAARIQGNGASDD